ncbi:uncharacterized protein LOC132715878 [Ruditapes philippinarum]|uniref:uncharacterized protein LOC132715878 n=1 Tax=Ruditapes philippinarum TaxID=129788 RepID=UPI00295B1ABA|nr:uncharacterized protein LOC132715878 [Ruditapes philippinarum]
MIQASYHQGDTVFKSQGRQCMVNSLCCILESKVSKPSTWTSSSLDKILKDGDNNYQSLIEKNPRLEYLLPSDLPETIFDTPVSFASPFSGTLNRNDTELPFYDINTALCLIRESNPTGIIISIGSHSPSYSSAIIWDEQQYYVFDPHSRNECGMVCADGKATLTVHKNVAALCLHLKHLCASIFTNVNEPFELCGVNLFEDIPNWGSDFETSSESGSDFSGFDPVSDSELILLKEKLQEIDNSSETELDESSCSSFSDLIDETLASQSLLDDSTLCLDETVLNNITIIVEEQNEPCVNDAANAQESTNDININTRKRMSRKRVRDESNWKRNVLKCKKNTGQSYETASGSIKRPRIVKNGCGFNCRKKCHSKIMLDEREKIFHHFWSTGSYEKQKEFIGHTILEVPRKRILNKTDSRRRVSRQYFFQMHGHKIQVCKQFYLDTLDISEAVAYSALSKKCAYGGITSKDQRGRHKNRPNKIPHDIVTDIKQHIASFPRVESHYCRKSSNKEYLEADLNLSKLYDLYKERCCMNNYVPQSIHTYRHIFNTQFNIAFNKPLKDQCDICSTIKNINENKENSMSNFEFERHIKNKNLARKEKEADKSSAKSNESFVAACFDLQQVFTLPKSFQGQLYYARKLNNYNLTIYSLGNSDAYCYIWNETLANRGSNEVSSCVF